MIARLRCFVLLGALMASSALAQTQPIPAPPIIGAKSFLMIDATTGDELASLQPDERLAPASLTKLMTAYVVFQSLGSGQVTLDELVTVSEKAWRTDGSRMFIEVGSRVRVEDLLLGMIVQSGNDASVALAEHIAGDESVFAELMNQHARQLGMNGSHFMNATGLPNDDHYSTARDLAILAQTDDAGWCLVSSAERNGMRIIAVVLGTSSDRARIDGSQSLLNYGFRFFETRLLYRAGQEITSARIWKSANENSSLGVLEDLYITIPRGSYNSLELIQSVPAVITAPVAQGQPVARITVSLNGDQLVDEPLRALDDNPTGSFWQRTRDGISLWFE